MAAGCMQMGPRQPGFSLGRLQSAPGRDQKRACCAAPSRHERVAAAQCAAPLGAPGGGRHRRLCRIGVASPAGHPLNWSACRRAAHLKGLPGLRVAARRLHIGECPARLLAPVTSCDACYITVQWDKIECMQSGRNGLLSRTQQVRFRRSDDARNFRGALQAPVSRSEG